MNGKYGREPKFSMVGRIIFRTQPRENRFRCIQYFRKSTADTKEFYGLSLLMIVKTEKLKNVYFIETELFLYEIIETG